jgi:hypothetical protein
MIIQNLEEYLDYLIQGIENPLEDKETVLQLGDYPYWEDHELGNALYVLHCQRVGIKPPSLLFSQLPSGAIPLYGKAQFPWGGLPYPKEHALLGRVLFLLGEKKQAESAASWQTVLLNHQQQPLASFLQQEKSGSYAALKEACDRLFECVPSASQSQFYDSDLGIAAWKDSQYSLTVLGSGCKSGIGSFLFEDVGIINFGPQFFPLGESDRFGIAGRCLDAQYQNSEKGFSFSFKNRISAPHPRKPPLKHLGDSGFSRLWLQAKIEFKERQVELEMAYEGIQDLADFAFVFFGKGKYCSVKKLHRLQSKSLDRYKGPPQEITFHQGQNSVQIKALEGSKTMEIIPLSGGNHFWGADFLVAYMPEGKQTFSIKAFS